jgi:hypothetical protein
MVTLLTMDGVEEIDYMPSDCEIRASLDDPGLYGMVLNGVTWIRLASGVGWWTVLFGKRLTVTLAALGWCWVMDGLGARGYWSAALSSVIADVCSMYGGCVDDEEEDSDVCD